MCVRESVCLYAAVAGHNLTSLFELGLTEREWKRAVKEMNTTNNMLVCTLLDFFLY